MNCYNSDCIYQCENGEMEYVCKLNKSLVNPDEDFECVSFKQLLSCDTCKYSRVLVYETGTIDSIEYRCYADGRYGMFVFEDTEPYCSHPCDFPKCDLYEKGI